MSSLKRIGAKTAIILALGIGTTLFVAAPVTANGAKTDQERIQEIRQKAEKGNALSQVVLGTFYEQGIVTGTRDGAEAVKWFRMAAEQGNPDGQYKLGSCYLKGFGVAKDETEAVKWFRKAAEQGSALAKKRLAELGK